MGWKTENEGARFRVVVTKDLPGERWREALIAADCEIFYSTSRSTHGIEEILAAIGDRCDGAIGQLTERWSDELFGALKDAGGVAYSNYAVGYDNVDVPSGSARGIAIGNTPGVLTETTAELAVALTYAAARRIGESERFIRAGKFDAWLPDLFLGKLLWGKTLGILGAGRIGSRYAKMLARASAMNVLYWSRSRNEAFELSLGKFSDLSRGEGDPEIACRRVESLEELLGASDVVAIHVPLQDATRHLIDARELASMKPDAILINTSRGPIVNENALVEHLRKSPDFRVGLDVFEREPQLEPGLAEMPNAVLVPHIGSASVWTREGMATLAACNVAGILKGYPISDPLDANSFLGGEFPAQIPSILNPEVLTR